MYFVTVTLCLLKKEKQIQRSLRFCPPEKNRTFFSSCTINSRHAVFRPDARGFVHVAKCSTAPTRGADGSSFAGGGNSKISTWWKLNQKRYPPFGGGLWKPCLGGGFLMFFIFTPGELIQFDEHIFQMGWFNPPTRYGLWWKTIHMNKGKWM